MPKRNRISGVLVGPVGKRLGVTAETARPSASVRRKKTSRVITLPTDRFSLQSNWASSADHESIKAAPKIAKPALKDCHSGEGCIPDR